MKVYLSGPMSGYDYYNFPMFDYAADLLRAEGHEVFSPADNDRVRGLTGRVDVPFPPGVNVNVLLKDDLTYILDEAEIIALLPGYEKSLGAGSEIATANAIGLSTMILGRRYWAGKEYVAAWHPDKPREIVKPHKKLKATSGDHQSFMAKVRT